MTIYSGRRIMIGINKRKHPMYDNDSKRKQMLIKGIIGATVGIICGIPFLYWSIMIILIELNKL
jgi:hypothetical protein